VNQHTGLKGFISLFATHRVAANLLMLLMIVAGVLGIKRLNVQFFPTFELDIVTVSVPWSGASAEDVQTSVILPVEEELRSLDGIKRMYATARDGSASFRLELEESADRDYVLSETKQKMDGVQASLPSDAESPIVQIVTRYDNIADLILTSDRADIQELRHLAREFEQQLLAKGIRKIDFTGMPKQEIAVQVTPDSLDQMGMTLPEIASVIRSRSVDLPAGTAAKNDGARQIRSLGQQRDEEGFEELPLITKGRGELVRLGDISQIERRDQENQVRLYFDGQPAIVLSLKRTESEDSLKAAEIMNTWLEETRPTLPQGVAIHTYNETWTLIRDRINLLVENGISGLILVVAILFLFLNGRVAFWVTIGIPVSFLATLAVLYLIGGTINMISLFGLIMALGIIVDDAIVVGEDTLAHAQVGESARRASIGGALRMLAPVSASSMTTIAAFLPLMMIGGIIGNILIDIPIIVICVILASLVESFLVLPGHLHHTLAKVDAVHPSRLRQALDNGFDNFRNKIFRPFVERAIAFRWSSIAMAIGILIFSIGLLAGGRIKFNFFPAVEQDTMNANVQFASGTDSAFVMDFLDHLDLTLRETDRDLGGDILKMSLQRLHTARFSGSNGSSSAGEEVGSLSVQLEPGDHREVGTSEFIKAWRERIILPAGIEKFSIDVDQGGPPGKPVEVKLTGSDITVLKAASLDLQEKLKRYTGLSNIDDDLPYGKSQLIYKLTPAGETAGLSLEQVGRQLRAAFDGIEVQSFFEGRDEISVRLMMGDEQRNRLSTLTALPIVLPDGSTTPVANVLEFTPRQGFDSLQRIDGRLSINVSADLDETAANANEIIADLRANVMPDLLGQYGVGASFEGKSRDQRETLADMGTGLVIALVLIYVILAWVFASYSWPITVMLAIPLGLTGAVLGHYVTGLDLTILSLFGFFGLSGIVINDSIVLVTFYKKLREQGMGMHEAVVEAACQRLRAVLLTSLTTIGGLTPILFETSLQAQFLIPMATSIVFGLAYGTLLILIVVPSLLTIVEGTRLKLGLKPVDEHAVSAPN